MTILIRIILVCLCGLVSALAVADSRGVVTERSFDEWLWSTGDFKSDRNGTNEGISGKDKTDATDHIG